MRIIIILGILSALSIWFRTRVFEALVWALLTTPILAYLFSPILGVSAPAYVAIMLISFLAWCFTFKEQLKEPAHQSTEELYTVGFFTLAYIGVYVLTQQWDQFFPMGERLRDYALLSSAIRSPINLTDPWLHGYGLNYYAYWYRFGHFLSSILGIGAAETYNQLQSLTYALFLTTIYRISTRFLGWSALSAVFSALLIGFGSNVEGIFSILQKSDNWWGPSRVIPGAIHEFPVWSFLLGDLHPHFLNLVGIPALLLLLLHIVSSKTVSENLVSKLMTGVLFLVCGALFTYNANAWEVPIWGLLVGGLMLSWLISDREQLISLKAPFLQVIKFRGLWLGVAVSALLSYSLWYSSRNILPNPFPISWVEAPILRTTFLEFMRHWGIPVILILSACATIPNQIVVILSFASIAIGTLYTATALPLLFVILFLLIGRLLATLWDKKTKLNLGERLLSICAIVAITLCLIPEFIFLNDPYGGENERMNTIFKIYSSSWVLFQLGALYVFRESVFKKLPFSQTLKNSSYAIVLIICGAFFFHTVTLRATKTQSSTAAYGSLASAEDNFPGSASTIQFLRAQPGTVVLEAQGNAYDWTSFVSTLSDKDAYLGWANHVNLLIREYGEITRREKITSQFYGNASCQERRQILEQEKIDFAIVGVLEEKKYPEVRTQDFGCLKEVYKRERYKVFSQ
jgi:YYY domain-containing protein